MVQQKDLYRFSSYCFAKTRPFVEHLLVLLLGSSNCMFCFVLLRLELLLSNNLSLALLLGNNYCRFCFVFVLLRYIYGLLRWLMVPKYYYFRIADVAVRKRHQRLGEIRIIFTRTSSKTCFQKSSVMQYTPSTINAIQFAQQTLAHLL